MITLTKNAQNRLADLLATNSKYALRFGVISGGCSGFSYDMQLIDENQVESDDEVITFSNPNVIVVMNEIMPFYLAGTEIDWIENMMGSSFQFNNPNEASNCGCGSSFSHAG